MNKNILFYNAIIVLLGIASYSSPQLKPHEQYEKVVGAVRGGQIPELRELLSDKNNPIDQQVKDEASILHQKKAKPLLWIYF